MTTVTTALLEAKTILQTLNPTPEPPPANVYVYPNAGDEPITIAPFPSILVSHGKFRNRDRFRRIAQNQILHHWVMEIVVYLGERVLPNYEVEEKVYPWYLAIATVLAENATLNGSVNYTGEANFPGDLIVARTGSVGFYDQQTKTPVSYWGIMVETKVRQQHQIIFGR